MISKIQTSKEAAFSIVGISVRTINLNNQAQNDISRLWGRFMGGNLLEEITDRL
jgi:predicted transcriptional regulator YdeE